MKQVTVLLAVILFGVLHCFGQQEVKSPQMSIQEARRLMKEAWEKHSRNPDESIYLLFQVLRHYPESFEVRLPEYLDDIWRTQGEEAYWKAVIEEQVRGTLHPDQMVRLTIGGGLANIYFYGKKDGRHTIFWAKQVLQRNPKARAMNLLIAYSKSLLQKLVEKKLIPKAEKIVLKIPEKAEMFVNGQLVKAAVEFQKQSAFVALQEVKQILGLQITCDAQSQKVTCRRGTREVIFEIGSEWGLVDNEPKELSAAPYIKGEFIMVPVDMLAVLMNGHTYWDDETKLVHLFYPE